MGRPRLFYVCFEAGRVLGIFHGRHAVPACCSSWLSFTSEHAAQECAAWHEYRYGR